MKKPENKTVTITEERLPIKNRELLGINKLSKDFELAKDEIKNFFNKNSGYFKSAIDTGTSQTGKYEVILAKDTILGLRNGTLEKTIGKNSGLWLGQVRDKNSKKIVEIGKLKEIPNKSKLQLIKSVNQIAMQASLNEIINQLEILNKKVDKILRGQHNDRMAELNSGINQYKQALKTKDKLQFKLKLNSASEKLNDVREKLMNDAQDILDNIIPQDVVFSYKSKEKEIEKELYKVYSRLKAAFVATQYLVLIHEFIEEWDVVELVIEQFNNRVYQMFKQGNELANYLPYDKDNPPEEIWRSIKNYCENNYFFIGDQIKLEIQGGILDGK